MEHTLQEPVGLTQFQQNFLSHIVAEQYFCKTFYLSGGTALSSWYINHRESYDLDFFSEKPFDYDLIMHWFHQNSTTLGYKSVRFDQDFGFLHCYISYKNNGTLRVDFHNYGALRMHKSHLWKGLSIDSFYDIAVNKLRTIATYPRARDYVDYYCLQQKNSIQIAMILDAVKQKFHEDIDMLQLARNFLRVSEFVDMPIMRIPFNTQEMIEYFNARAKELEVEIML